jgi:azurin
MVVVLVTAVLVGGGYLLYTFVLSGNRGVPAAAAAKSAAPGKADQSAQDHPYAKYLEVVGIRLTETGNKPVMKMLVVNHSAADMTGLELKGTLGVVNGKPDDPPVATFTAKVGSIGPYESKDVSAEVSTKMRAYELPDWQFLSVKYDITSPR